VFLDMYMMDMGVYARGGKLNHDGSNFVVVQHRDTENVNKQ